MTMTAGLTTLTDMAAELTAKADAKADDVVTYDNDPMNYLSDAAAELAAESDAMNALIAGFEAQLRTLNVGEHWYRGCVEGDWYDDFTFTHLGFTKLHGQWNLCVRLHHLYVNGVPAGYAGSDDGPEEHRAIKTLRLLDSSRTNRIAALKVMPDFLEQITTAVRSDAASIHQAREALSR